MGTQMYKDRQVLLKSGHMMPLISVGTFKIKNDDVFKVIDVALSCGYRSFDTAQVYKNEKSIGNALKILLPKYFLSRKDVFITTKVGPRNHGSEKCRSACMQSLENLQTDYLDLYLIHWPGVQCYKPGDRINSILRKESWLEMENLVYERKIKSIGVSNYTSKHLDDLLSYCSIQPSVLQIEYHPHLIQLNLLEFCRKNDIHLQAYSSLGSQINNQLLNDKVVCQIASKNSVSSAQVLLRWSIQQQIGVIPKSTNHEHIANNINIFEFVLIEEYVNMLNSLNKNIHYCWNPECVL